MWNESVRKTWHTPKKEKEEGEIPVDSERDFLHNPCYGRRRLHELNGWKAKQVRTHTHTHVH